MESWAQQRGNLSAGPAAARLRTGVLALALALGVAVTLVYLDVGRAYRLLLVVPLFMAANGFYQALYRT